MKLDIISCRILYAEIFIKIRILLYEFPCKIVYKYLKVLSNSLRIYQ